MEPTHLTATRSHPLETQTGQPCKAAPCHCPEPVGDPREGSCILCGHQVPGYDIPVTRSPWVLGDRSAAARKARTHRPAP